MTSPDFPAARRYYDAVERNLSNCLRDLRHLRSGDMLVHALFYEGFKRRLGIREDDPLWDVEIHRLRCAALAAYVLTKHPEASGSNREWLQDEPFCSLDGSGRMAFLARLEHGVKVLAGDPSAVFGFGHDHRADWDNSYGLQLTEQVKPSN